jgi:hypothetical protein
VRESRIIVLLVKDYCAFGEEPYCAFGEEKLC